MSNLDTISQREEHVGKRGKGSAFCKQHSPLCAACVPEEVFPEVQVGDTGLFAACQDSPDEVRKDRQPGLWDALQLHTMHWVKTTHPWVPTQPPARLILAITAQCRTAKLALWS